MPDLIYVVIVEMSDRDDAFALSDIIAELGYHPTVKTKQAVPAPKRPMRETRMGKLILGAMIPGRSYIKEDFEDVIAKAGYRTISISPIMSYLVSEGDVERIAHGTFRLKRPVIEVRAEA